MKINEKLSALDKKYYLIISNKVRNDKFLSLWFNNDLMYFVDKMFLSFLYRNLDNYQVIDENINTYILLYDKLLFLLKELDLINDLWILEDNFFLFNVLSLNKFFFQVFYYTVLYEHVINLSDIQNYNVKWLVKLDGNEFRYHIYLGKDIDVESFKSLNISFFEKNKNNLITNMIVLFWNNKIVIRQLYTLSINLTLGFYKSSMIYSLYKKSFFLLYELIKLKYDYLLRNKLKIYIISNLDYSSSGLDFSLSEKFIKKIMGLNNFDKYYGFDFKYLDYLINNWFIWKKI